MTTFFYLIDIFVPLLHFWKTKVLAFVFFYGTMDLYFLMQFVLTLILSCLAVTIISFLTLTENEADIKPTVN